MSGPRVRFAPSPTGSLHLGNARTALFNWLVARRLSGTFIVRIEDTDTARERVGSEASILEDLRWLGLDWDEGPYRQSDRLDSYVRAAQALAASGGAFRCFCPARGEEEARAAGHRDPCRSIPPADSERRAHAGEPHAVRLRVPERAADGGSAARFVDRLRGEIVIPLAQLPDAVLLRHDRRPTYNFAAVVDDLAMHVDLIIRGDDHLTNSAVQVLIAGALGAKLPELAHLPMVLGPDGERLSKRHGAASVSSWRKRGVPPEALLNGLALLGWSPPSGETIVSREDLVAAFDLDRVGRASAVFDPAKLEWISSQHIRAFPAGRLASEVGERLVAAGRLGPEEAHAAWVGEVAELLRTTLAMLDQIEAQTDPLFHEGGALDDEARAALAGEGAKAVLLALRGALETAGPVDATAWASLRAAVQSSSGVSGKQLFQPLRVALTGRAHGRELDRIVPLADSGHRTMPQRVPSLLSRTDRTLRDLP